MCKEADCRDNTNLETNGSVWIITDENTVLKFVQIQIPETAGCSKN